MQIPCGWRHFSSFIKTQHFLALAISKQGDLLTLNSAGDLLKAQASNGNILWAFNTTVATLIEDTDFFKSSDIVIYENDIIFSTTTSVSSYNLDNGIVNWKEEIGSKNTPIISGNNVFIITDNGYFVNLDRKTVYITNVVNFRPPKNRRPTDQEIQRYYPFLKSHIEIINPKILVLFGSTALNAIIGNEKVIFLIFWYPHKK